MLVSTNKTNIKIAFAGIIVVIIFLLFNFIFSAPVLAQDADELAFGGTQNEVGEAIGLGDEDPRILVARIINIFLGFLGIIAVILIMYAGWLWMVSEGNEEKVSTAKKILQNAFIGLVIVLISFGAVTLIFNKFFGGSESEFSISSGGSDLGFGGGLSSLGGSIIESHYPARNEKDISRNTMIVISFKEEMDPSTIIEDTNGNEIYGDWDDINGDEIMDDGEIYDKINANNILVYKQVDGTGDNNVTDLFATTNDNKTFVFMQQSSWIGSPSEEIWYSVTLTNDIEKADDSKAFPGTSGYEWSFQVSTMIDVTPPKIEDVYPIQDSTKARNVVIQINFNEAINPISASGSTDDFNNIEIRDIDSSGMISGIFYISNQYKTVEFLTEEACGINSCGKTVYCLPSNSNLSALVKAAESANPFSGVVDMSNNSLDGDSDGDAEGPPIDNYEWFFSTNDTIDISPPVVTEISPNIDDYDQSLNVVPEATFNKRLFGNSINTDTVSISPPINYWVKGVNTDDQTAVKIYHDNFTDDLSYSPSLNQGIMDVFQNCYSVCNGVNENGDPVVFGDDDVSCCNGFATTNTTCD